MKRRISCLHNITQSYTSKRSITKPCDISPAVMFFISSPTVKYKPRPANTSPDLQIQTTLEIHAQACKYNPDMQIQAQSCKYTPDLQIHKPAHTTQTCKRKLRQANTSPELQKQTQACKYNQDLQIQAEIYKYTPDLQIQAQACKYHPDM